MLKAGAKQGIFIPVSRVNTAYEYYNMLLEHDAVLSGKQGLPGSKSDFMLNKLDEDDDWKVNIVWTDIQKSDEQNDIEKSRTQRVVRTGRCWSGIIYLCQARADSGKCVDRN